LFGFCVSRIAESIFNEDVFDSIAEIIKVTVVPVVTLVIGYYFGCERGRDFAEVERD